MKKLLQLNLEYNNNNHIQLKDFSRDKLDLINIKINKLEPHL